MKSFLIFIGLMVVASQASAGSTRILHDTCPYECCHLGAWEAEEPAALFSAPNGKSVGTIQKGEHVTALKGDLHVTPVRITVLRDHPAFTSHIPAFRKGDVITTGERAEACGITYRVNGKTPGTDACIGDSSDVEALVTACKTGGDCWGKVSGSIETSNIWWVKVKTENGNTGWVNSTHTQFSGRDSCS